MIRTDQNVMDTRRDECLHHGDRALRRSQVVRVFLASCVEDELIWPRVGLVYVDERLMLRIVGEQVGVDRQRAWRLAGNREPHSQCLIVRQHLDTEPRGGETAIGP